MISNRMFSVLYALSNKIHGMDMAMGNLHKLFVLQIKLYLHEHAVIPLRFLMLFRERWEEHLRFSDFMRRLFLCLDRNDTSLSTLQEKATLLSDAVQPIPINLSPSHRMVPIPNLISQHVFNQFKSGLVHTVQKLVIRDRTGEAIDFGLLKAVVQLFLIMGIVSSKRHFRTIA